MIEQYEPIEYDGTINEWEQAYSLDVDADWNSKLWNARATHCNHPEYNRTIHAINQVVSHYRIHTDIEGCTISPLHYLFAKYIGQDDKIPLLLKQI